jgi:hypothetical protein
MTRLAVMTVHKSFLPSSIDLLIANNVLQTCSAGRSKSTLCRIDVQHLLSFLQVIQTNNFEFVGYDEEDLEGGGIPA